MHRLVLVVDVARMEHGGDDGRAAAGRARPIRDRPPAPSPGDAARGDLRVCDSVQGAAAAVCGLEGRIGEPQPEAAVKARLDVAHALQFAAAIRGAPACVETRGIPGLHEVLRGQRAAADRLVHALDLRDVERARRVADQQQPRRIHPRQRLPAAGRDRACAVAESSSPPSSSRWTRGWCLNCWKASKGAKRGSA